MALVNTIPPSAGVLSVPTLTFLYNMVDAGNCEINPFPLDVEAKNMGHALQKIAACLSNDCVQVIVWRKGE